MYTNKIKKGQWQLYDVVALGELLIDFTPIKDLKSENVIYEMNPGGAPANVLTAVSRLGGRTAFIGKVGDDSFGYFLRGQLCINGINTNGLKYSSSTKTTLAFVHLDDKGDRSFSFYRDPGADTTLEEKDLALELIKDARIFHFGSLSLTDEPARSSTLKAVQYAKSLDRLISFDPNWRPALWGSMEAAKAEMERVLQYIDIIKISVSELEMMTGQRDLDKGSRVLIEKGIKLVVITLGPGGCYYKYSKGDAKVRTYDTNVVDTTGAGDAFTGGLLYRISRLDRIIDDISEDEMKEIIDFSNAVGALCAAKRGAIPAMPSAEKVDECRKSTALLNIH